MTLPTRVQQLGLLLILGATLLVLVLRFAS